MCCPSNSTKPSGPTRQELNSILFGSFACTKFAGQKALTFLGSSNTLMTPLLEQEPLLGIQKLCWAGLHQLPANISQHKIFSVNANRKSETRNRIRKTVSPHSLDPSFSQRLPYSRVPAITLVNTPKSGSSYHGDYQVP